MGENAILKTTGAGRKGTRKQHESNHYHFKPEDLLLKLLEEKLKFRNTLEVKPESH